MTVIVFLHIPKTAGQAVHYELVKLVGGKEHVSPVRVHTEAPEAGQMPPGYRLYSGHLDWTGLDAMPRDRFVFSVLRDPRERIASFYFYLLKEARALSPEALVRPDNHGKKEILERTADDYFFGGDEEWQTFIRDHYDNFYCSYFATRKIRGRPEIVGLPQAELLERALAGLNALDGLYSTDTLTRLEDDIEARFGKRIAVAGRYFNIGEHRQDERRWPKLMERLEADGSAARLDAYARHDDLFMEKAFCVPAA